MDRTLRVRPMMTSSKIHLVLDFITRNEKSSVYIHKGVRNYEYIAVDGYFTLLCRINTSYFVVYVTSRVENHNK